MADTPPRASILVTIEVSRYVASVTGLQGAHQGNPTGPIKFDLDETFDVSYSTETNRVTIIRRATFEVTRLEISVTVLGYSIQS